MSVDVEVAAKWVELTDRDLAGAKDLFKCKHYILACYHCQQALEKILKAYLFAVLGLSEFEKKYRIHHLIKLATYSKLEISDEMWGLLENLNPMTTDARYEVEQSKAMAQLMPDMCERYVSQTEEFVCWIKNKLN